MELSASKTKLVAFGRFARERAPRVGKKPETFDFLGLTHYCGTTRKGHFKVKRQTSRKKFRAKLQEQQSWLKQHRHRLKTGALLRMAKLKLAGHLQYYAITDNGPMCSAYTLQVFGTGFVESSEVRWNGEARPTNFLSSTRLQAAISASDISQPGSSEVIVFTPPPGGGLSNPLPFVIDSPGNLVPVLNSLDPASGQAGEEAFNMRALGSGFVDGSEVRWNGETRVTTFISSGELRASITASDIAEAATVQVSVFNPAPGGGLSDSLPFVIDPPDNPVPVLSSLEPASAQEGDDAFTLRALGSGFVEGSEVRWNGEARVTTFTSSQELQANIPASDIAGAGSVQVTVFNPAPGEGISDALLFEVRSPTAPAILDVQAEALEEESAKVTVKLEDPDGDIVKLKFSFFLSEALVFTREVNSPQDVDLAGFTSGTQTFVFTELGVDTGFGRVLPNKVEVTAEDAEGLVSDPVGTTF